MITKELLQKLAVKPNIIVDGLKLVDRYVELYEKGDGAIVSDFVSWDKPTPEENILTTIFNEMETLIEFSSLEELQKLLEEM